MCQTKVVEKIKHTFYVQELFYENRAVYKTVGKYDTVTHVTDDNVRRSRKGAVCMPDY
jgi:hypothetical protein